MAAILLVGVPRSGTSWTAKVLRRAEAVRYVLEPDGFRDAFAFRVMLRHGSNPLLAPGESAPEYERLWSGAFAGGLAPRGVRAALADRAYRAAGSEARDRARAGEGRTPLLSLAVRAAQPPRADPSAVNVLVKSVQCARSVEWIQERFAPQVVMILRHPLNTLASWRDLNLVHSRQDHAALAQDAAARWGVEAPEFDAPMLARQAFDYGVLTASMLAAASRHPDWCVVRHEQLCSDAPSEFRALADRLGLVWTDAAEQCVHESDRAGDGFETQRVASRQGDRWRERLDASEIEMIRGVLATFPQSVLADC